ncbi:MAG: endonuclease/exonuclease/phosphatase family protein [Bacteroidota bacterium]
MFKTVSLLLFFSISALLNTCTSNPESVKIDSTDSLTVTNTAGFKKGIVTPVGYEDTTGDTIKILSWNVEHFIDSHDDPYVQNNRENNGEKMEGRVSLLIQALRKADADIVVLQEFEHVQFIQQLAADSLSDMKYQFFADSKSINWYMNVVVMSRVPLGIIYGYGSVTTPVSYVDEESDEERYETQNRINTRMWSVDVLVNDQYSFLLTGVHLKAGRGARNEAMRLGQIQFLKGQFDRFTKEDPEKNILIVGDFNATPDSKEFQFMLDGNSPVKFIDNVEDSVFSHPADSPRWRIDHILPNQNMQSELVKNTLKVTYFFDKETQRKLADHLPLVASFITRDKEMIHQ